MRTEGTGLWPVTEVSDLSFPYSNEGPVPLGVSWVWKSFHHSPTSGKGSPLCNGGTWDLPRQRTEV